MRESTSNRNTRDLLEQVKEEDDDEEQQYMDQPKLKKDVFGKHMLGLLTGYDNFDQKAD